MIFAICDDNPDICIDIRNHINQYFKAHDLSIPRCEIYHSGKELVQSKLTYDIVFIDVEMPGINGINACRILSKRNTHTLFIMVTSHDKYIDDAFSLHAFRFLTKPIDWPRFDKCLMNAINAANTYNIKVNIPHVNGLTTVYLDEIIMVETYNRKTQIHTIDKSYISAKDMVFWESLLNTSGFFSPTRGCLINMEHVKFIDNNENTITMDNGKIVYISRRRSKSFRDSYLLYIKSVT